MRNFRAYYWIVIVLMIGTGVVSGIYLQHREATLQEHAGFSRLLLSLREKEARLDREVLKVTSFQVNHYDHLVDYSNSLQQLLMQLQQRVKTSNGKGSSALKTAIIDYQKHLATKLALIERVKSDAGLVRNGLLYLPLLISQYANNSNTSAERLPSLLNRLYAYSLFQGKTEREVLEQQIASLNGDADYAPEYQQGLNSIRFHMSSILDNLKTLDELNTVLEDTGGDGHFDMLDHAMEQYRTQNMGVISRFGIWMLILVGVLALTILYLLTRLSGVKHDVEQSWTRLRDAVNSLGEAFALFDRDGQLVLFNQTWLEYYPWLKGHLHNFVHRTEIEKLNASNLEYRTLAGAVLDAEQLAGMESVPKYLEKSVEDKWYLASDSQTQEGGVACVRTDISESKQTELQLKKLSRALEQSPASVVITDTNGIIEYVNPKFEKISGYSAAEVIGQNPRILQGGDNTKKDYRNMWDTLIQGRVWRGTFHNRKKDGSTYWESASISPIRDDDGQMTHYIGVKEDITAQKRAQDQLRMNATVFETTTEGIMVTNAQGYIKTVNPAFTEITGYAAEEAIGQKPGMLASGRHEQTFYEDMWKHLQETGSWAGEIWNRRKDDSVYPEWLSIAAIKDEQGEINEYVAIFSDITQRKQNEEQILYQANYDMLTNLPNRTLAFDRLIQSIVSARREHWGFALLFLDLDRFKAVNDLYGHVVGDEMLQQVANKLKQVIREVDTLARFGGDEFVILLHAINDEDDAALVAGKLIDSLIEPFHLIERSVSVGVTIGITLFPEDADPNSSVIDVANAMLSNADMAMYQAKSEGRNQFQFFQRSMQRRVVERLALEQELAQAIERDELLVYYQPIHEAYGSELVGVEALIRWQHPKRGLLTPVAFIDLAEETGLIGEIGEWVFRTASKQVGEWRSQEIIGLNLSVNLSARQRGLGFNAQRLAGILEENSMQAKYITLEITENLLMEESSASVEWLDEFRAMGVKLAIDDFGTGYSSLSYLKRFPVNALKIDRSFVRDLPSDREDESLIAAIVAMADSLGLEVVAEGVETEAQRDIIKEIGCDYMQGYLFGRPMPADEMLKRYGSGFE